MSLLYNIMNTKYVHLTHSQTISYNLSLKMMSDNPITVSKNYKHVAFLRYLENELLM